MASILKRKNSYFIAVSCGYGQNGKQVRRTMTYKPDENMTQKQIEKEVRRQAVLFEEKVQNGQVSSDGRIKLCDFVPIYLETAKQTFSPYVYECYTHILNLGIIPALGHMKLKDIRPLHIQRFIDDLSKRTTHFDGVQGKLSASTIRRYYTMVQSVLHSAYKLGIIGTNPADSDRITLPKVAEQTTDIFSDTELSTLLECLESEPMQFRVLIHLALNTGCRRGELTGLKWSDINFNTGILTVSRSNYKLSGDTEIRSKSTKTGKSRKIMLPPYCVTMLQKFKVEQAKNRLILGDRWQGGEWIFTQADGKAMYPTTPTQWFNKFLKRNNLPHRKFHALRHTSATILLSNGTNIKNVAQRLGHSQLKTTDRYVHAVEQAERKAVNTLESIFNSNRKMA